ncbi:hypothetical protein [Kitasatospora sp. NPDC059327]|uniref:hypothetical protein n=1 Tax=Kitasatospora sp. NPDC059327 TaxID=3346803 RepID=UPI0036A38963
MSERQSVSNEHTFILPTDPDDTVKVEAWLRPLGWCVEPDPAQARPGYLRLRPLITDPDDHDGGRTFAPGSSVRWTGVDIVRVAPTVPGSLRPFLERIGNPAALLRKVPLDSAPSVEAR